MDFSLPSAAHSYFYRYCNFPFRLSKSSIKVLAKYLFTKSFPLGSILFAVVYKWNEGGS